MNPELEKAVRLFEENDVDYWVDYGTLLGLVRGGRLLASDADLDISARFESTERFDELVQHLERNGYQVTTYYLDGLPFKLKAVPGDDGVFPVDVDFFRTNREGSHLWCPQLMAVASQSKRTWIGKVLHFAYKRVAIPALVNRGRSQHYGSRLLDPCFGYSTWWVPADQIGETVRDPTLSLRVPADVERHLTLHYGNWRVPQTGWVFTRDDQSLRHQDPRDLLRA